MSAQLFAFYTVETHGGTNESARWKAFSSRYPTAARFANKSFVEGRAALAGRAGDAQGVSDYDELGQAPNAVRTERLEQEGRLAGYTLFDEADNAVAYVTRGVSGWVVASLTGNIRRIVKAVFLTPQRAIAEYE